MRPGQGVSRRGFLRTAAAGATLAGVGLAAPVARGAPWTTAAGPDRLGIARQRA